MHLKQIEINGFKSFAEKTVLDFVEPRDGKHSVTAVVGPNGSGKSNILDAIKWVMGEQSLKALRGRKSEDIIFTGSDAKGQMGAATVSMTLDNIDGHAPIDTEEIIITRKLYRSGEGEYLINGKKVRLLDLQILLAKAQFGHGSYSAIGQGTIDRLLLQTPQERKQFFDEASGIKEFQIKRHQAVLKLHRTSENISQAEILLNEISPRLRSLSRQVKKLEQRQSIESKLRCAQESYYSTVWNFNQNSLDEHKSKLDSINDLYKKQSDKLLVIQEELAELAKEDSRQDVFAELQAEYHEITKRKNDLERRKALLAGRLQQEYSKAGKHNLSWLESKIEALKVQQAGMEKDLLSAEKEYSQGTASVIEQKKLVDKYSIGCADLRSKIASLDHKINEAKEKETINQFTSLVAVQAVLENRHQFGTVYGAVAQLGDVVSEYQLALDVAGGGHISSLVVDTDSTAGDAINYLRTRKLGVATFLPLNKVKPRYLSMDIDELVCREGVLGLASNLIEYDEKFENIFSYVFGNTLIVEDIDVAKSIGIGKIRMVTLTGDVMETSGSMKGGYRRSGRAGMSFGKSTSPYLLQGKIEEWKETIAGLRDELKNDEIKLEETKRVVMQAQSGAEISKSKTNLILEQKSEIDKELSSLEQEKDLNTMSEVEYNEAMKSIEIDKKDLDKKLVGVEEEFTSIEKKISSFNENEENKKKRIFTLQEQMQARQEALNKIVDDRNGTRVELAKLETKQEDLINEVYQELKSSIENIVEKKLENIKPDDLENAQQNIQKLKYKLSLIGGIDEEVVDEFNETKERHDDLFTQLEDLQKAIKDLETLVSELDDIMKKKRAKAFKQIKKEFSRYFELLFDGGRAQIVELYGEEPELKKEITEDGNDEDEIIEELQEKPKKKKKILQGIDIMANPPGKKVKHIQALSGGEKTLTSIALVCAILRINPSPFVVLDEVEAALDESNTVRFTKILDELAEQSQFVIITHNRATMHSADALYGVTMGNDGISKLLSVKIDK